ncbi:MAG TPA: DUF885 domain-containing protein [Acidobacteriaceae bacterium]|nr:DUF885 domain-containing protein [Acidobacteriaceae bacterium]
MIKPAALLVFAALILAPLAHSQTFPKSVQKQAEERSSYPGTLSPNAAPPVPQSLADRRAALNDILTQLWQDHLARHPLFASVSGDHHYDTDLPDYSVSAWNAALDSGRRDLLRLGVIDTTGMTPEESLSDALAVRYLVAQQQAAEYKPWQMPITPYSGPQINLIHALPQLRFSTVDDYDNYAARLSKLPAAIRQATNAASFGIEEGRVPPKFLLQQVLTQVNAIGHSKPEDTPFAAPLKSFPASISTADRKRITDEILTAIRTQVQPAYVLFGLFLSRTYVPAGRANAGIWSIPAGDAYYAFLVNQSTTTTLTPQQVHQLALHQVAQDEAAMLALAQKLGLADLSALRHAVSGNYRFQAYASQELSDIYKSALPAIPSTLPPFRRYARYPAFMDGWALYIGTTSTTTDPYQRLGLLELDRYHAALAVADTGIHALQWTRQQAVDYVVAHTMLANAPDTVASAMEGVDRVIAQPAQSLGATIGEIEFTQLRAQAQQSLGPKFSLSAFNQAVLASGPLPMDLLQQHIEHWIAAQKGSSE